MCKRSTFIAVTVVGVLALLAGLGVLIWWLVDGRYEFTTNVLEGGGFPNLELQYQASFTDIRRAGSMFWWFWPSVASGATARPLILWLDGVTGLPPSLHANFAMFGPLDFNFNRRNDSWIDEFNLLLVDAPLGTGFSTTSSDDRLPTSLDENTDHLLYTLQSFYSLHSDYEDTPLYKLYIFGQGQGAQLALSLAVRIAKNEVNFSHNLRGVVLGNGIISPALALSRLGFYLEEMGYVDAPGRSVIEDLASSTSTLVDQGQLEEAFDKFLSLEQVVNEEAGTFAVNLGYIIEKLTRSSSRDFGLVQYLKKAYRTETDLKSFMENDVAPALGISAANYDQRREAAVAACRSFFMGPLTEEVEFLLTNTELTITIYNGNLDAVSNTPGQLDWVENLNWTGQDAFRSSPRQTLIVDGLVQGYFRETNRLAFYWINATGQSVPRDSPRAMRRVLQRITT